MSEARAARYVSLHTHSAHSPRDGLSLVDDLVTAAAADGQPALAITDHGTVSSAWKLAKSAKSAGIKPIIGMEAYLAINNHAVKGPNRIPGAPARDREDYEWVPRNLLDADGAEATDGESTEFKKKAYEHLTILAATAEGYQNLSVMSSKSADSFHGKPLIDHDLIREHHRGLIILTGCISGPIAGALALHGTPAPEKEPGEDDNWPPLLADGTVNGKRIASANLRKLISVFDGESADYIRDHLFIEVMEHGIPAEQKVTDLLFKLAARSGKYLEELDERDGTDNLPLRAVATNDSHYTASDDHDAHEVWLCIGSSTPGRTYKITDNDRWSFSGSGYHLRTYDEMIEAFSRYGDMGVAAVEQSAIIAESVEDDVLPEARIRLPKFPIPDEYTDPENPDDHDAAARRYIQHLINDGASRHYGENWRAERPDVKARLNHELSVIRELGFVDYFLIVHDLINWARENGIRVGPGRGSAAGSMVSYTLGIVQIDPLENGLLFERFLDSTREEMPDIDLDFDSDGQARVFAHLTERWGQERVARLGTFGFSRAKQALKNAARATLDDTKAVKVGNQLSNLVPGLGVTLDQIADPKFGPGESMREKLSDPDAKLVFDTARSIEGVISNEGVHACGIIVATEPLAPMVPLRRDRRAGREGTWVTQFDGKDVADMGLLKLDALGLRNLDIISEALRQIRATDYSEFSQTFDPEHPPTSPDDPMVAKTWRMLSEGRTTGVFQLESSGMTRLTEQVAPENLNDLSALVALYRPGPLSAGFHEMYARRKHGEEPVDYSIFTDDETEQEIIASVLENTYGLAIYQEQLMQLGTAVAGFGPAENNRLRRAVSKKKHDEMIAVGKLFRDGAQREITDEDGNVTKPAFAASTADNVWDAMKGAGEYSFNKSHSAAYGYVSYVTAFLKANWPTQYGAATLACTDSDERRGATLGALRSEGVTIKPPSVCDSDIFTSCVDADGALAIRLGLGEIKGVGSDVASAIVSERRLNGSFTGIANMMGRVTVTDDKAITNASVAALIDAGACDTFSYRDTEGGITRRSYTRKGQLMAMAALRSSSDAVPVPTCEFSTVERAARERQRLGVLLSRGPLQTSAEQLKEWRTDGGEKPRPVHKLPTDSKNALTLGVLASFDERGYSGGRMAKFVLQGGKASLPGVMFGRAMKEMECQGISPSAGDVVALRGKLNTVETRGQSDDSDSGGEVASYRQEMIAYGLHPVEVDDDSDDGDIADNVIHLEDAFAGKGVTPGATTDKPTGESNKEQGEHRGGVGGDDTPDTPADDETSGAARAIERTSTRRTPTENHISTSRLTSGVTHALILPIPDGMGFNDVSPVLGIKWTMMLRKFKTVGRRTISDSNIPDEIPERGYTDLIRGEKTGMVLMLVSQSIAITDVPVVIDVGDGTSELTADDVLAHYLATHDGAATEKAA